MFKPCLKLRRTYLDTKGKFMYLIQCYLLQFSWLTGIFFFWLCPASSSLQLSSHHRWSSAEGVSHSSGCSFPSAQLSSISSFTCRVRKLPIPSTKQWLYHCLRDETQKGSKNFSLWRKKIMWPLSISSLPTLSYLVWRKI